MHRFLSRAALCALAAVVILFFVGSAMAQAPARSALQYDPKVLRYDVERDKLYHHHSALTTPPGKRPGGHDPRAAYHGNRLRGYRFIGPVGQGGIYDAFREDQVRRNLDPKNYQYRTKYPATR